jgi:hypothetical protein
LSGAIPVSTTEQGLGFEKAFDEMFHM